MDKVLNEDSNTPKYGKHAKPQESSFEDARAAVHNQSTGSQKALKQSRAQAQRTNVAQQPERRKSVLVRGSDWNSPATAHAQASQDPSWAASRASVPQNQGYAAPANQGYAQPASQPYTRPLGQNSPSYGQASVTQSWQPAPAQQQTANAGWAAARTQNQPQAGANAYAGNTRKLGGNTTPVNSNWDTPPASARGAARASRGGVRSQRDLITGKGAVARRRGMPNALKVLLLLLLVALIALGAYWWMLNDRLSLQGEDTGELVHADIRDPFYMLVLGSDSREHSGTSSKASESGDQERSDVMILLRVDQANNKLTMLSIPRDTPIRDEEGNVMRINEAFNRGGARYAIQKVQEITGAPISHYAQVRMSNFEEAVDNLGGLDMNVPIDLSVKDTLTGERIEVPAGQQHVNGKQAQALARARHEYQVDQDVNRQSMVRQLVVAMLESTLNRPMYAIPGAVLDVASCVGTDLNSADLMYLAAAFAGDIDNITIYSATGPTAGDWRDDLGGNWYCYDNPEGWANVMAVIDAGEDPSTVDVNATAIIP